MEQAWEVEKLLTWVRWVRGKREPDSLCVRINWFVLFKMQ